MVEGGDEVGAEEDMQIIKVNFSKSFLVQNVFRVQHMLSFIPDVLIFFQKMVDTQIGALVGVVVVMVVIAVSKLILLD